MIAAVHTLGLYSIIWLAIGSNLLSKTQDSGYFGIYQVNIILQAPFKALKTGRFSSGFATKGAIVINPVTLK